MRFLNLKKKLRFTTCYERILSLRCGPNFVLNRVVDFKAMIKDQGVKFWFRFWLNFCFYPEITQQIEYMNSHAIEVMRILCDLIHKRFVEGSPKDSINYCLHLFKYIMKQNNDTLKNLHLKPDKEEADDSLAFYLQFHFGCALCEVFYIWLEAHQNHSRSNYWSVPDQYLDLDFQPRLIEHYIVAVWAERICDLLGLSNETIPWLETLLTEKNAFVNFDIKVDNTGLPSDCSKTEIHCLNKKLNIMKIRLLKVDEKLAGSRNKEVDYDFYDKFMEENTSKSQKCIPRCAFCFSEESFNVKLKACSLCKHDKIEDPKLYCGVSCQTEDWFRNHAKEHFRLVQFFKMKPDMTERHSETDSIMLTSLVDH